MCSRSLRVLAVSSERKLLRRLAKFLGALGYETQQVADVQQAAAVLEDDPADFLIVDSSPGLRQALQLSRTVGGRDRAGSVYTLLLVEQPTPDDIQEALQAGVDDFLAKPIIYGELLARLRAGARSLQFEQRWRRQAGVEPLSGLPNRWAFCDRLRSRWAGGEGGRQPATCILADLDFLDRINRQFGRHTGDTVIRSVAAWLVEVCGETGDVAHFGGGRFCVFLDRMSDQEAAAWAERARDELAKKEISMDSVDVQVTASFGIALRSSNAQSPEMLVDRALQALLAAKSSGRNCVVDGSELNEDAKAWVEFSAPGKLFERTRAKDVMTPCTLVLSADQTAALAAELLRRSGLKALPVVDAAGKFQGIVTSESVLGDLAVGASTSPPIRELMTTDVPVFGSETPFATLRDFFTQDPRSLVVIVDDDRPTGLLAPDSLAALSMPLRSDSFAGAASYAPSSDYLRVGDLCPLSDA